MNMSYCKMENTAQDIAQCMPDLEALLACSVLEDGEALSERELAGAVRIAQQAAKLVALMEEQWGVDLFDLTDVDQHIADALGNDNAMIKEKLAEEPE